MCWPMRVMDRDDDDVDDGEWNVNAATIPPAAESRLRTDDCCCQIGEMMRRRSRDDCMLPTLMYHQCASVDKF